MQALHVTNPRVRTVPPASRRRHAELVENIRRRQLAWLAAIVDRTGLTRTEIARRAGVAPSTLSKFTNDVDNVAQLEAMTVSKIEAATGIELATFDRERRGPAGRLEEDGVPFPAEGGGSGLAGAIAALTESRPSRAAWQLRTHALEAAGYLPGDVVIVEINARPRDGDVVLAQAYDAATGEATAIFRVWHRPYFLAAASSGAPLRPLIVDDETVVVRGVVVAALRARGTRPSDLDG